MKRHAANKQVRVTDETHHKLTLLGPLLGIYNPSYQQILDAIVNEAWDRRVNDGKMFDEEMKNN